MVCRSKLNVLELSAQTIAVFAAAAPLPLSMCVDVAESHETS